MAQFGLSGQLLQIEDVSGDFVGDDGGNVAYAFHRLHVLQQVEGAAPAITQVKLPKGDNGSRYTVGQDVDLVVNVTAEKGARSAYLKVLYASDVHADALASF